MPILSQNYCNFSWWKCADKTDRWIKTEMGHKFADSIGYAEGPPQTLDECVSRVVGLVCTDLS